MMRHLSMQIDKRLREVENWWKLQCFLKRTIRLALCVTLFVLTLGTLIVSGWITEPAWANSGLVVLGIASIVTWLIIALVSAGMPKEPEWLAAALEKSRIELEDRLNTLIYLQGRQDRESREISRALEHQVHRALRAAPSSCPFSWKQILRQALTFAVTLLITIAFYNHFQPWNRLHASTSPAPVEDDMTELDIPESPQSPQDEPVDAREQIAWGEVRITEPGRDLKVTRLDLIPMQIEAASNRTLKRIEWVTLISEGPTERHGLAAPEHPNYAVYRPSLIVEDYGLEEWDVMSYYAEASTEEGERYQSVEYFIEIVPPRTELEQLPEPAYQSLEEITGLIEWQQEVIRETGRLSQFQGLDEEDRQRRQGELAAEEQRLKQAIEHLSARLESQFGTGPLEGMRERFQSASFALEDAQKQLEEMTPDDSNQNERTALGRLVDVRKHFHARVKQDPAAFDISPEEQIEQKTRRDQSDPLDEQQAVKLQQRLQERQQSLHDVQDELQKLIEEQRLVELKTRRADDNLWKELAEKEQQLNQNLQQLAQQSPETSEDFEAGAKAAGETLERSQQALTDENKSAAEKETARATEQLEQLAETLNSEMDRVELARQMLLEERLRCNREEYRQIEEQAAPRTAEQLKQTTDHTQEIVEELESIAKEQPPPDTPEAAPSDLQRELTPEKKNQLAGQCNKMCQQPGAEGQSQTAGEIGRSLDKLADALQKQMAGQLAQQGTPQLQQNLNRMQATSDQLAQAREAVQKALAEQAGIERSINPRTPQKQPELSQQQKQATDALEDAMQRNPEGFSQCQSQAAGATNAMRQSERSLQSSNPLSRQRANEAAEELRRLDSALEEQQQNSQLADAYRQKQMLDEQIEQLKRFEQNPESVTPSQCQSSGGACKNLTGSMQQLMQQPGMQGTFGPQLQEALSDENKQQIDQQSDALANSETPGEVESSAGQLRQSLEQIAQAFESGQPNQGQSRRPGNSLKPSGQQAISQGLRRLESESQRNRQGRPVPSQESQQLREDALSHLAQGLYGEYGYNEQTRMMIARWREELQDPDFTVDQRVIQQLLRDIQQTRGEIKVSESDPNRKPGVQTIDPSKYPPEYRPLIESYFQKLSERP